MKLLINISKDIYQRLLPYKDDLIISNNANYLPEITHAVANGMPISMTMYISIDDVMSVFNDYMRGEADEEDTDTFLKMLKDKAESEEENDT